MGSLSAVVVADEDDGAHPRPQDRSRAIGSFKKSIDMRFPWWLLSAVRQIICGRDRRTYETCSASSLSGS